MVDALVQFRFFLSLLLIVILIFGAILDLSHAVRQDKEAFIAVDKLSKSGWVLILSITLFVVSAMFWLTFSNRFGGVNLLFLAVAAVAEIVYWVDVRPRVEEVQRKR